MSISLNAGRSGPWLWSWSMTALLLLNTASRQPLQEKSVCSVFGSGVELLTSPILIPACAEQKQSSTSRKCPVFILSTEVTR